MVQALQNAREEKLKNILKDRLQPFVEGRREEFMKWANSEAMRLSRAGNSSSSRVCLYIELPLMNVLVAYVHGSLYTIFEQNA